VGAAVITMLDLLGGQCRSQFPSPPLDPTGKDVAHHDTHPTAPQGVPRQTATRSPSMASSSCYPRGRSEAVARLLHAIIRGDTVEALAKAYANYSSAAPDRHSTRRRSTVGRAWDYS